MSKMDTSFLNAKSDFDGNIPEWVFSIYYGSFLRESANIKLL